MASSTLHDNSSSPPIAMGLYPSFFFSTCEITIPPLTCSLSLQSHPHLLHSIQQECHPWMLAHFNPSNSEQQTKLLLQSQFPLLVDTFYGDGTDKARIIHVAKVVTWLFAIDDVTDDQVDGVGSNSSAAAALFRNLLDALNSAKTDSHHIQLTRTPMRGHELLEATLDCWAEILRGITCNQHVRILQAFGDTFEAWQAQISSRQAGNVPDLLTYIQRRRKTSILHVAFVLLEYVLGIELDEETLSNDLLSQLHDALIDHISWVNDLVSLKAEYFRGEFDNIPSVLCFHKFHDFQTSVEIVSEMIAERDNAFVRLRDEIMNSKVLMARPGVKKYVESLGKWLPGNLYFSYVSARYHGVDSKPNPVDAPLTVLLISGKEAGGECNGRLEVDAYGGAL